MIGGVEPNPGPKRTNAERGRKVSKFEFEQNKKAETGNQQEKRKFARYEYKNTRNNNNIREIVDDDLEHAIARKAERNRPKRTHFHPVIPFSAEAERKLRHMTESDEKKFKILERKYLSQTAAARRIRSRLREILRTHREARAKERRKIKMQIEATVPNFTSDVLGFINRGNLNINNNRKILGEWALKMINNNKIFYSEISNFINAHHEKLRLQEGDIYIRNKFGNVLGVSKERINYINENAESWFQVYVMSSSILEPLLETTNYIKKRMRRQDVVFVTGTTQVFKWITMGWGQSSPGTCDEDDDEGLGMNNSGPFFMGSDSKSVFVNYYLRDGSWVAHGDSIITIGQFRRSNNAQYSRIRRMLLLLAGIEPNPGPDLSGIAGGIFLQAGFEHLAEFFGSNLWEANSQGLVLSLNYINDNNNKPLIIRNPAPGTKYIKCSVELSNFEYYFGDGTEFNNKKNNEASVKSKKSIKAKLTLRAEPEVARGGVAYYLHSACNLFSDLIFGEVAETIAEEEGIVLDSIVNPTQLTTIEAGEIPRIAASTMSRMSLPVSTTKSSTVLKAVTMIMTKMAPGEGLATFVRAGYGATESSIMRSKRTWLMLASPFAAISVMILKKNLPPGLIPIAPYLSATSFTLGQMLMTFGTKSSVASTGLALSSLSLLTMAKNENSSLPTQNELFVITSSLSLVTTTLACSAISKLWTKAKSTLNNWRKPATTRAQLIPDPSTQDPLENLSHTLTSSISEESMLTTMLQKCGSDLLFARQTQSSSAYPTLWALCLLRKFRSVKDQLSWNQDSVIERYSQQISLLSKPIIADASPTSDGSFFITFLEMLLQSHCSIWCEKCFAEQTHLCSPHSTQPLIKLLCQELSGRLLPTVLSTCCSCRTLHSEPNSLRLHVVNSPDVSTNLMECLKVTTASLKGLRILTSQDDWVSISNSNNTFILVQLLSVELRKIWDHRPSTQIPSRPSLISLSSNRPLQIADVQTLMRDLEQKLSPTIINTQTAPSSVPSPTPSSAAQKDSTSTSTMSTISSSETSSENVKKQADFGTLALPCPRSHAVTLPNTTASPSTTSTISNNKSTDGLGANTTASPQSPEENCMKGSSSATSAPRATLAQLLTSFNEVNSSDTHFDELFERTKQLVESTSDTSNPETSLCHLEGELHTAASFGLHILYHTSTTPLKRRWLRAVGHCQLQLLEMTDAQIRQLFDETLNKIIWDVIKKTTYYTVVVWASFNAGFYGAALAEKIYHACFTHSFDQYSYTADWPAVNNKIVCEFDNFTDLQNAFHHNIGKYFFLN